MSDRRRPPAAAPDRSGALSPPALHSDPLRPILMPGEGLPPAERERRRLELRRQWTGRLIALTPELRDPRNLDGPLAISPQFPWDTWLAAHPTWSHPEFRQHRYAMAASIGVEQGEATMPNRMPNRNAPTNPRRFGRVVGRNRFKASNLMLISPSICRPSTTQMAATA